MMPSAIATYIVVSSVTYRIVKARASRRRRRAVPRGEIERLLHGRGEIGGLAAAPVVEKEDARRLPRHVRVDGDHVDPAPAQRLEHVLELALGHREVAVDDRRVVGPAE